MANLLRAAQDSGHVVGEVLGLADTPLALYWGVRREDGVVTGLWETQRVA